MKLWRQYTVFKIRWISSIVFFASTTIAIHEYVRIWRLSKEKAAIEAAQLESATTTAIVTSG